MKTIKMLFNQDGDKTNYRHSLNILFTLMLLLVSSPSQAKNHDGLTPARENVCSDAGLTGDLLGICRAYGEAQDCDLVSSNENRTSCEHLEHNFREKSDGRELSSLFLNKNVEQVIPQEGGAITLRNVVTVEFPMNAFAYPNKVTISTTKDPVLTEEFDEFTSIFRTGARLAYEIHINTSTEPPLSDFIVAKVVVPAELSSVVPSGYQLEAFAKVESGGDEESHDLFELIPASFDPVSRSIVINLPGAVFSNKRNANSTYEAIITLAATPGINRTSPSVQRMVNPASSIVSNNCLAFPIDCPVEGGCTTSSPFVPIRANPVTGVKQPHSGVDYVAIEGTNILAADTGKIEKSYYSSTFGNTVIVRHDNGSATLYAHLQKRLVIQDQGIQRGEIIGTADSTGRSTGSHLHFEYVPNGAIIKSKDRIDPVACVNQQTNTGSIKLSDNGTAADDAFSAMLDGVYIGVTEIGQANTLSVFNLIPGTHTLNVTCTVAPDNLGTLQVDLNDGLMFSDGTDNKSANLSQGGTISYSITVPEL